MNRESAEDLASEINALERFNFESRNLPPSALADIIERACGQNEPETNFPNSCQDGHVLIGFSEECPICQRSCGQDEDERSAEIATWRTLVPGYTEPDRLSDYIKQLEVDRRSCGETAWVGEWVSVGMQMITDERRRQVSEEGWTPEHDNYHVEGELALAAACYASPIQIRAEITSTFPCGCREACCSHIFGTIEKLEWKDPWPWEKKWDKRKKHDRIRQLAIAGALIAAEIDRLNRALPSPPTGRTNAEEEGR